MGTLSQVLLGRGTVSPHFLKKPLNFAYFPNEIGLLLTLTKVHFELEFD
jgi:hypothetical protein